MIIDFKNIDSYFINLDKDTEKAKSAYLAMENCGIKNIKRYDSSRKCVCNMQQTTTAPLSDKGRDQCLLMAQLLSIPKT
jgi:hypothetical protein